MTTVHRKTHPTNQEIVLRYARLTGDCNPIHIDPEFAKTTRYGGCIVHGTLLLGYVSQAIAALEDGVVICGFDEIRFLAPCPVGAPVEVVLFVPEELSPMGRADVRFYVYKVKDNTTELLVTGKTTVKFPWKAN
jgi:acyl dehydratase